MSKNIILIILFIANGFLAFQLINAPSIDNLSIHILTVGVSFIITILFLITTPNKIVKIVSLCALIPIILHIYEIVMVIYDYVYA